jgi:hypothetical protein
MLSVEFLIIDIMIDVKWNLIVVLIWSFLVSKDLEYFFNCFSFLKDFSIVNSLVSSALHFLMGYLGFLEVNFLSSFFILNISPL